MPKPLVIVESPAKAKTISGYLGRDYLVESSIGHIRDTVYVLRADTGEEVYRRYLPMYVRSTVAFFDAGHFAYCDLAGTHILVLPK